MEGFATGLDKHKLIEVGKAYGLDLSKYLGMVLEYENEILKKQSRDHKERQN